MRIAPTGGDDKSSDVMATENQPATLTAAEPKAVTTSASPTQPQNAKPREVGLASPLNCIPMLTSP